MDPIDAAATPPLPIDAAAAVDPIVDAADVVPPVEVDGGPVDPYEDAGEVAEVGADVIAREFNRYVSTSGTKLDRCYQSATKGLPDDQPLRGEVDIELGVMPTGQVGNVRVVHNSTGSDALGRCVTSMIESWTFSPHDGAGAISLARKFGFGPQ